MIGHTRTRKSLEKFLPPVTLLVGPKSVGKWTLAEHLREFHGFRDVDVLRIPYLSNAKTENILTFQRTWPVGQYKLCIVRIDTAHDRNLNMLLKTLEETTFTKFILVAEDMPIETVVSRAFLYQMGLLSDEEVAAVLALRGFKEDTAQQRAVVASGRVDKALEVQDAKEGKLIVLRAVQAIHDKDAATLESLTAKWKDEHTELLLRWCSEQISNRWKLFSEDETSVVGQGLALKILMALRADVKPRLMIRYSLMKVLRGTS